MGGRWPLGVDGETAQGRLSVANGACPSSRPVSCRASPGVSRGVLWSALSAARLVGSSISSNGRMSSRGWLNVSCPGAWHIWTNDTCVERCLLCMKMEFIQVHFQVLSLYREELLYLGMLHIMKSF